MPLSLRNGCSRSLRDWAMQSACAVPLCPAHFARSSGVARARSGPVSIVVPEDAEGALEGEAALGLDGLIALGEVALPAETAPAEPPRPELALESLPAALPGLPEVPELPSWARTRPLASAPAAKTASAFNRRWVISVSSTRVGGARSADGNHGRKRHAIASALSINRLRSRRRPGCRAKAAPESEHYMRPPPPGRTGSSPLLPLAVARQSR